MVENIIELKGEVEGPRSMILVGVHGDEKCGVEALEKMLPSLRIDSGVVYIAYGNPEAIERQTRFFETNLNRMFKPDELLSETEKKSYEYGRAQYLKKYLNQADALLDIHASFTPASRRFIICEPNAEPITKYLPFDLIVSGFDAIQPGGTDYYMNQAGKVGICIECGYLGDPQSVAVAEKSIISFLGAAGHIANPNLQKNEQVNMNMEYLHLTRSDHFVLSKPFADFEELKEGQLIGRDGEEEIRAPHDGIILFARNSNSPGEEAFLFGGYKKA